MLLIDYYWYCLLHCWHNFYSFLWSLEGVAVGGSLTNTGCVRGWPELRSVTSTTISSEWRETAARDSLTLGLAAIFCLERPTELTLCWLEMGVLWTVSQSWTAPPPPHNTRVHCIIAGHQHDVGSWRHFQAVTTATAAGGGEWTNQSGWRTLGSAGVLLWLYGSALCTQVDSGLQVNAICWWFFALKFEARCEDMACGSSHDTHHIRHQMTDTDTWHLSHMPASFLFSSW